MVKLTALGRSAGDPGHSIDLDLLPDAPVVLDAGCRGFAFTRDLLRLRPKARVIALDPDPLICDPLIGGCRCEYQSVALIAGSQVSSGYISTTKRADGNANFLAPLNSSTEKAIHPESGWAFTGFQLEEVACINIGNLMRGYGVDHWDLVKFDIEGAEFEILENWPGPIATQISVEFHDFTGPRREKVNAGYYENVLWPKLPWYRAEKHDWVDLIGNPAYLGHWDSLLVLK